MPAFFNGFTLTSNIPLATGLPTTCAFWVKPDAAVFKPLIFAGTNVGGSEDLFLGLGGTANQNFVIGADGTGTSVIVGIGTVVSGAWTYVIGRWSSAINRWIHLVNPDGTISSLQDTTTVNAPSGMTQSSMGGNFGAANFAGTIAELWVANIDVQPDGAVIDSAFLWQLAKWGPFSVKRVSDAVQYYQPFIQNAGADYPDPMENYSKNTLDPIWTNTGVTNAGQGPPILYPYPRPNDFIRRSMI